MTPETELLVFRVAGVCIGLFAVWFTVVSVAWGRYSPLVYCFGPALLREELDAPGHPLPPVGSLFFSEVGEFKVISPTEVRGRYARQSRYDMGFGTVRMSWTPAGVTVEGRMYPAWAVVVALTSSTFFALFALAITSVPPVISYPAAWILIFTSFMVLSCLAARQQDRRLARDYLDGAVLPGAWSRKAAWQLEDPDDVPVATAPSQQEERAPREEREPPPPLPMGYEDPFSDADEPVARTQEEREPRPPLPMGYEDPFSDADEL